MERRRDPGSNVFYDFNTSKNLKRYSKTLSIHGEIGGWSFALERLLSFNGSVEETLFDKLKEIELRYNCIKAKKDYFDELLSFFKVRK